MFKQSTSVSGPQKIGAVCQMVDWACLSFQDTDKIRFEMNNKTKIHMPPLHVIIIFSHITECWLLHAYCVMSAKLHEMFAKVQGRVAMTGM